MRCCRRRARGQLNLGFVKPPARIHCFPCAQEYLAKNMPAHVLGRDHKRSMVRQNPTPRWRKPRRPMVAFIMSDDYEDRMWAEQEAREREDEASRMAQ